MNLIKKITTASWVRPLLVLYKGNGLNYSYKYRALCPDKFRNVSFYLIQYFIIK